MAPRRVVCPPSFWERYGDRISIYSLLLVLLTGAVFAFFWMNQQVIHKTHHFQEKINHEIISTLRELRRSVNNIRNFVHSKDTALVQSVRGIVRKELEFHNANKTAVPDYALESTGAYIITTRQTEPYDVGANAMALFGIPLCKSGHGPNALIQPGVMPGECWAFKGQAGTTVIRLITKIRVTGVSVEHVARNIAPAGDTNSAPKEFSIWGLHSAEDTDGFFFGQFTYDTNGTAVQHFPIVHKSIRMFDIVEFKVHSNHGHPEYTCIYRLRVHGDLE